MRAALSPIEDTHGVRPNDTHGVQPDDTPFGEGRTTRNLCSYHKNLLLPQVVIRASVWTGDWDPRAL